MSTRNIIAIVVLFVVLLGAIFVTLFLISSSQDTRSNADTPDDFPVISEAPIEVQDGEEEGPGSVDGVRVDYPNIEGDQANWEQANCSWNANTNASTYSIKVLEVDTETVIAEESVNSGVTNKVFPITSGNTYRCEVAAVNSAGVAGTAGFDEQVCVSDAPVTSPSPVASPSATIAPTAIPTVVAQPTVTPTLPPTGSFGTIATIGLGGVILMLIGGALLFL